MKGWSCLFHNATWFYTRCTKTFEWHQNSHPISQSCLLKGKKHKMLQSKKQKKRSSRRKSAPLTSVNHRTPSPIWAHSIFWTWVNKKHVYQKSQHQKCDFSMHLEQFKPYELHDDNRQTQSNAHLLMPKIKLSFSDFKPLGQTICTPALSSLTYHH